MLHSLIVTGNIPNPRVCRAMTNSAKGKIRMEIHYKYKSILNSKATAISKVIRKDRGIGYVVETPWGKEYVLMRDVIKVLKR